MEIPASFLIPTRGRLIMREIPNPNRKWYQFWKPKMIPNPKAKDVTIVPVGTDIIIHLDLAHKEHHADE